MGCMPLADDGALWVSCLEMRVLLCVSLQCNECHTASGVIVCWVESPWPENPRSHCQWAMRCEVPSAEVLISLGHHVVLWCGIERGFLLCGLLW